MNAFPRYTAPKVNRSFAFDPETLAKILAITSTAVQETSVALAREMDKIDISDEERHEALSMLATNIAKGVHDAIEQWKNDHRQPRRKPVRK
jgi:hypothetical protein